MEPFMLNKEDNQNQHYVPQNYFKEFSRDGASICCLIKKNRHFSAAATFKKQSSDDNFYGDREREREVTVYDTKYSKNRKAILGALIDKGATSLSPSQLDTLLENTQFQLERTLTSRNAELGVLDFHKKFFAPQVEDLVNYDSGHSLEATEAVRDAMELFFKALSDPRDMQYVKLMQIKKNKDEVLDLCLVILRNCTARPFIFSDSPVAYANPALSDFKCSKLESHNVGLQIFYPLNPEYLALFYDPEAYRIETLPGSIVLDIQNAEDIRQLNKLQVHEATNSIYFGRIEDSDYVKALWQEERPRFQRNVKSVESVNQLSMDGYATGRKVYTINESDPTFSPTLSFVVTSDLSDSNLPYRACFWRRILPEGAEIPKFNDEIDRHSGSQNYA